MVKERTVKEVDKIINNKEFPPPKNFALASAWILADFKGINLKIFDVQKTSSLADYYVLASAQSTTAARSMTESVLYHLKRHQLLAQSVEGVENAEWILLDCGDIIVHIFQETIRSIFDLDHLWRENPVVSIPQEYYFTDRGKKIAGEGDGKDTEAIVDEESTDSYFS